MKIRKFEKEDILQVLELCREVRNHHREFLGGYFAEQDDEMGKAIILSRWWQKKKTKFKVIC